MQLFRRGPKVFMCTVLSQRALTLVRFETGRKWKHLLFTVRLTQWEFFPTCVPHMPQSLFSCCRLMKPLCNSFRGVQQVVLLQEKGVHKPANTRLFMGKHITWQDAKPCISREVKLSTQGAVYNKRKLHTSWGSLTCTDTNTRPSSAYTLNKRDIHILTRSRQPLPYTKSLHKARLSYLAPSRSYWSCHQTERKESRG